MESRLISPLYLRKKRFSTEDPAGIKERFCSLPAGDVAFAIPTLILAAEVVTALR
jgi:hypothetical protein